MHEFTACEFTYAPNLHAFIYYNIEVYLAKTKSLLGMDKIEALLILQSYLLSLPLIATSEATSIHSMYSISED